MTNLSSTRCRRSCGRRPTIARRTGSVLDPASGFDRSHRKTWWTIPVADRFRDDAQPSTGHGTRENVRTKPLLRLVCKHAPGQMVPKQAPFLTRVAG
jgi:hypothetical protein